MLGFKSELLGTGLNSATVTPVVTWSRVERTLPSCCREPHALSADLCGPPLCQVAKEWSTNHKCPISIFIGKQNSLGSCPTNREWFLFPEPCHPTQFRFIKMWENISSLYPVSFLYWSLFHKALKNRIFLRSSFHTPFNHHFIQSISSNTGVCTRCRSVGRKVRRCSDNWGKALGFVFREVHLCSSNLFFHLRSLCRKTFFSSIPDFLSNRYNFILSHLAPDLKCSCDWS